MQTMELVDIEDVYPYEDNDVRMNPRDVTSRECREYIAQLAEQFRHNRLNPGQPRVRPILYRDGGIYQIIDGECRYEAMKLAGTKRFYADVFDDLADAELARQEAAKAMVETDAKRALTAEEMSRGVQTMLALDVPEEEAAASARVDVEKVRRARRGARAVSDAAYDMTLDRLAATAEFEGDEEAVAKLRDCAQSDWRRIYDNLVQARERREREDAARAVLGELGVELVDETPAGLEYRTCVYLFGSSHPEELVRVAAPGAEAASIRNGSVFFYGEPREKKAEPSAEDTERERIRAAWDDASGRRARWVAGHMGDPSSMADTAGILMDRVADFVGLFEEDAEEAGTEVPLEPCALGIAVGWSLSWWPSSHAAANVVTSGKAWEVKERVSDAIDLYEAMVEDGYEPDEDEERAMDAFGEWLAKRR